VKGFGISALTEMSKVSDSPKVREEVEIKQIKELLGLDGWKQRLV